MAERESVQTIERNPQKAKGVEVTTATLLRTESGVSGGGESVAPITIFQRNKRGTRVPTKSQIFHVEEKRAVGEYEFARDIAQPVVDYPLDNFSILSRQERQRYLTASRIALISELSLANEQPSAQRVVEHLTVARNIITTIYENPSVQATAHGIQEDVWNSPCEFATEMARDKVLYMLIYAALISNKAVVTEA